MANKISSPDGKLVVNIELSHKGTPLYSVRRSGKDVIKPSSLGLVCDDMSFDSKLTLEKKSEVEKISDDYQMLLGKQRNCSYRANQRVFTFKNTTGQTMQIIFQVSNDGVAFRYAFADTTDQAVSITEEKTAFAFAPDTVSWLTLMQPGKTNWCRAQPAYEDHYSIEELVGKPSPQGQGWCLPALFKTSDDIWVLICDSDIDRTYCAARLGHDSAGGVYKIAFPHPEEHRGTIDPVAPLVRTPFQSPWRVLIIGDTLNTIVASTLITDVATPCKFENTDFIKPGRAAWHWLRYGDDSATLPYIESFLDFAAKMKWEYILVDASWDTFIGYEKIANFVKQAHEKNVDVILWYNSNGNWNDVQISPKDKMHERTVRRAEFAKLKEMGVTGVKIDFFGGDKQATMALYLDIFEDAADYGILVNCHGATIPRGWQRTYPNLVSMEAVRGMEYCTFEQVNADRQPQHCAVLPFTRNAIGSMDFTPLVFDPQIRGTKLTTTLGFELALLVIFESGIQHFGLVPDEYKLMPDFVVDYLQKVPTVWDQTRLVDGYPAQYAVIARQSGKIWYIGGINGTDKVKSFKLDLSFLPTGSKAILITDGPDRTFVRKTLEGDTLRKAVIEIQPHGGFTITAE